MKYYWQAVFAAVGVPFPGSPRLVLTAVGVERGL